MVTTLLLLLAAASGADEPAIVKKPQPRLPEEVLEDVYNGSFRGAVFAGAVIFFMFIGGLHHRETVRSNMART